MFNNFALASLLCSIAAFAAFPATAADVNSEITTAAMHAGLAAQAADIATVHAHLHHTVNCLVGPGGAGFDAKELNPCANSGNGAIPDSGSASTKQSLQAAVEKANSGLAANDLAAAQKDASSTEAMLKGVK
jgi:hypothetical protein